MSETKKAISERLSKADDLIERLFCAVHNQDAWDDDDFDDMLEAWRKSRGEEGKTPWCWWSREMDDEAYQFEGDTKDSVIAQARKEHGFSCDIEVMEGRYWDDDIEAGQDIILFAETRNREVIKGAVNDV